MNDEDHYEHQNDDPIGGCAFIMVAIPVILILLVTAFYTCK